MRNYITLFILISLFSCNIKENNNIKNPLIGDSGLTEFVFNKEIHNFGVLEAGEIVIFNFVFTNTGDHNLIIDKIESSCDCIKTSYNKNNVPPGEKGIIEVIFDTSGLFGNEFKIITLNVNTEKKIKELAVIAEIENKNLIFNNL